MTWKMRGDFVDWLIGFCLFIALIGSFFIVGGLLWLIYNFLRGLF